MAEGDAVLFNNYKEQLLLGDFNLSSNTIKVALVSGVTPDRDTHDYWDDPAPRSRLAGADPNQARRA